MRLLLIAAALAIAAPALAQQQGADPDFKPQVARPAFTSSPVVAIDEGHRNLHTAGGAYAPFAGLLRLDGWQVRANAGPITASALAGVKVLVIANAQSAPGGAASAFTEAECATLRRWVEEGGALLLIADHAPFGTAAETLAGAFGVGMGKGYVFEPSGPPPSTWLVFDRASGRLADHPITRGRDLSETVKVVRSFTGQSLAPPAGAVNLMRLAPDARETPDPQHASLESPPAVGTSQGLAMTLGKGRVVVLGEAAMLSAQVLTRPAQPPLYAGMNVRGYDNQQFALNLMRWLGGAL
jgi:hypothetical protein